MGLPGMKGERGPSGIDGLPGQPGANGRPADKGEKGKSFCVCLYLDSKGIGYIERDVCFFVLLRVGIL